VEERKSLRSDDFYLRFLPKLLHSKMVNKKKNYDRLEPFPEMVPHRRKKGEPVLEGKRKGDNTTIPSLSFERERRGRRKKKKKLDDPLFPSNSFCREEEKRPGYQLARGKGKGGGKECMGKVEKRAELICFASWKKK